MRIDATRKRQTILSIENLFRALSLNIGSEPGDFSILDCNIEAIDRGPVRADQAGIFDHDIEKFFHARLPWLTSCSSHCFLANGAPRYQPSSYATAFVAIGRRRPFILF